LEGNSIGSGSTQGWWHEWSHSMQADISIFHVDKIL
jgi:hypothetical protein